MISAQCVYPTNMLIMNLPFFFLGQMFVDRGLEITVVLAGH